jgi:hypothetical protein
MRPTAHKLLIYSNKWCQLSDALVFIVGQINDYRGGWLVLVGLL